jgi:hypothetical protein
MSKLAGAKKSVGRGVDPCLSVETLISLCVEPVSRVESNGEREGRRQQPGLAKCKAVDREEECV